jgi:hypothetical protein
MSAELVIGRPCTGVDRQFPVFKFAPFALVLVLVGCAAEAPPSEKLSVTVVGYGTVTATDADGQPVAWDQLDFATEQPITTCAARLNTAPDDPVTCTATGQPPFTITATPLDAKWKLRTRSTGCDATDFAAATCTATFTK